MLVHYYFSDPEHSMRLGCLETVRVDKALETEVHPSYRASVAGAWRTEDGRASRLAGPFFLPGLALLWY